MELLTKKEQAIIAELAPTPWFANRCNKQWLERVRKNNSEVDLGRLNLHWLLTGKPYMSLDSVKMESSVAIWKHYTLPIADLQLPVHGSKLLMPVWDAALTFKPAVFYMRMFGANRTLLRGMLPNPDVWEALLA